MADSAPLVLGTRASALALAQTHLALAALRVAHPGGCFEIREIRTTGDKRQDLSLTHLAPGGHGYDAAATIDGTTPALAGARLDPGLFTKELEQELLAGTISVAVHSLKDLPTAMPAGLVLAAVLPRAAVADVLIYKEPVDAPPIPDAGMISPVTPLPALPPGALIATSSLRRQYQLRRARPDWRVCEVRGNVGTRLQKLHDHEDWSGLVLALAGLERLGYPITHGGVLETSGGRHFRTAILGPEVMLPAVGQGAIGLQARADDYATLRALAAVNDASTWAAVTAERELLRLLGGGCQLPLGVQSAVDVTTGALRLDAVLYGFTPEAAPRFARAAGPLALPAQVAVRVFRQL